MTSFYADDSVTLHHADCLDVLRELPDASVDAVVTDPPYSLGFMSREWDTHDGREDSAFAYWLTGFIDGEGCFRVQRHERGTYTCTFSIKVRRDERGTLERIRRFLGGAGTIRDGEGTGNAKPQCAYTIQDKAGCLRLVRLLDKYPLQAKKRLDYQPWAEAVIEWNRMKRGHRWSGRADWSRMAELKARVEAARQYVDPPWSGHDFQDWCRLWAAECLRILKPGGHLLAFGGSRTWHRLACAVEDAGFDIRDSIAWLYGSGFPKSLDVSKAIDKAAGAQRADLGPGRWAHVKAGGTWNGEVYGSEPSHGEGPRATAPATEAAQRWNGWGTALKPAFEPIVVARKPLVGTVAGNVLQYGTGALNVDACRIAAGQDYADKCASVVGLDSNRNGEAYGEWTGVREDSTHAAGRWPTNVVLDESQAADLDQQTEVTPSNARKNKGRGLGYHGAEGERGAWVGADDAGGASRFFPVFRYEPKAPTSERPSYWTKSCECEDSWPTDTPSLGRDIAETTGPASSNTSRSGNATTDALSPTDSKSTTSTATSSTTIQPTSSPSHPPTTSAFTPDARFATASGGNRAASAVSSSQSLPNTGTSHPKDGPCTVDAVHATSPRWSQASVCGSCGAPARRNSHATVKPLDLMRWLVRLVTPPGGLVLDPFAGSGTTAEACVIEGFRCICIEREADYLPLIVNRLSKPIPLALDFGEVVS